MYLVELHGKLPSRIERQEDILTSNVFSFFKYSNREIFLKEFLIRLGFDVTSDEAKGAEFIFWPRFEENTEPDLVIIVGNYYLVIEAKHFSDFNRGDDIAKHQLLREIESGELEAKNYGKKFKLITITADYYYKKNKFTMVPRNIKPHFKWTNWQTVAAFLSSVLESDAEISDNERCFAQDLYKLLDKKNLRDFQEFRGVLARVGSLREYSCVFFESARAEFRGDFIGFVGSLSFENKIVPNAETIFFCKRKRLFDGLLKLIHLNPVENTIFFGR